MLWRVTRDPVYREWGWLMFRAWQKFARVATGGYASLNSVLEVRCTPDKPSYTASNLLPSLVKDGFCPAQKMPLISSPNGQTCCMINWCEDNNDQDFCLCSRLGSFGFLMRFMCAASMLTAHIFYNLACHCFLGVRVCSGGQTLVGLVRMAG